MAAAQPPSSCIFCKIAGSTSDTLLHQNYIANRLTQDDKTVAFQDINPSALRHYLVIPIKHIPTVRDLKKSPEDFSLVSHMLEVGQSLLNRDAPHAKHYSLHPADFALGTNLPYCLNVLTFRKLALVPNKPIGFRFGFHQPPFNSVNHLHLHCFALPFIPRWKAVKYLSLGPFGGFIEAEKLLQRIKP